MVHSTDVMKFNGKDVDGNIAMSGVYIPKKEENLKRGQEKPLFGKLGFCSI